MYHNVCQDIEIGTAREMSKSPQLNQDPTMFKPERWLPNGGNKEPNLNGRLPKNVAFGFGRRYVEWCILRH